MLQMALHTSELVPLLTKLKQNLTFLNTMTLLLYFNVKREGTRMGNAPRLKW